MIAFEVFCHSIIYSRLVQHFFMIAPSNNHLKLFKLIRVSNATIFQLFGGYQLYWRRKSEYKENATDLI
jgi:hypothetical protein